MSPSKTDCLQVCQVNIKCAWMRMPVSVCGRACVRMSMSVCVFLLKRFRLNSLDTIFWSEILFCGKVILWPPIRAQLFFSSWSSFLLIHFHLIFPFLQWVMNVFYLLIIHLCLPFSRFNSRMPFKIRSFMSLVGLWCFRCIFCL